MERRLPSFSPPLLVFDLQQCFRRFSDKWFRRWALPLSRVHVRGVYRTLHRQCLAVYRWGASAVAISTCTIGGSSQQGKAWFVLLGECHAALRPSDRALRGWMAFTQRETTAWRIIVWSRWQLEWKRVWGALEQLVPYRHCRRSGLRYRERCIFARRSNHRWWSWVHVVSVPVFVCSISTLVIHLDVVTGCIDIAQTMW